MVASNMAWASAPSAFSQPPSFTLNSETQQVGPTELAKRRRKLSPEHDKKIGLFKKHVELLSAKIGDIRNDSLREEFAEGFRPVLHAWGFLRGEYDANGLTDDLLEGFGRYQSELQKFEDEYEL
jgi:hypothetical protein